ncbi:MAG: FtsW/RodA/SpoVE family cell cycle protein, partial [Clostridiales bacterium]|nr:FtsW/RodA/SpoVE family cell cycle protein [Clostridiales bacterium]
IRDVKAWFEVALGRMLQPSEFVKITIILMLAKEFASNVKPLSTLRSVIRLGLIVMVPAGITFLSGETGSVIIMLSIAFTMLFFSDVDWKWLLVVGVIALLGVAAFFAYGLIGGSESYIFYRIRAFVDPLAYSQGAGLQLLRSQQAIGSGGLTGVGLFVPGSMSQLNFVPEDWTDFVFATVGEAVGFIGTTIIVLLFLFLILRMLYLSRFTYDKFGRQVIIGVMALMFFHVFQNIAMTIGLMPITGIPLPFISYGGSNLLTNVIGVSLVLNVTNNRRATMSEYELPAGSTMRKRRRKRASIFVNMTQRDSVRNIRKRRNQRKQQSA